jgi:hypothetical protein
MPEEKEMFYRYEVSPTTIEVHLVLEEYPVIRRTPKGVWVDDLVRERFVLLSAVKKFAYPTKEEALESFKARKGRYIRILKNRLERAEAALSLAGSDNLSVTSNILRL